MIPVRMIKPEEQSYDYTQQQMPVTRNYEANTRDEGKNLFTSFEEACEAKELPI